VGEEENREKEKERRLRTPYVLWKGFRAFEA